MGDSGETGDPGAGRALLLATVGFAVAFAAWGLIAGLAPLLKERYALSATQVSAMVAIPVLLGPVGRLPMGLLADRAGAPRVMGALLLFITLPAAVLAAHHSYTALVVAGFFLGAAGTAFSVGVAFVAPWFPPGRQGFALGVFGAGNVGQSIAVLAAPALAGALGISAAFVVFGIAAAAWGVVVLRLSRKPPVQRPVIPLAEALAPLRRAPLCWLLSLFYFLTFGGFVALGIYLPSLLRDVFHLAPTDAGARAAGFVLLATAARPLGGWLSDRAGGARVLAAALAGLGVFALLLMSREMLPFTVGALACAFCLGLGNGAVFKLVPEHFPTNVGTITGLVGAAGGLGGFFPPLVLGQFRDHLGSYAPGFALLAVTAVLCLVLDAVVLMRRGATAPAV